MPVDRPDTVILCGTFSRNGDLPAHLKSAGYEVLNDPGGDLPAAATPDGMRLVVCEADAFRPDRLHSIIEAAAGSGARALVVSNSSGPEQIISCVRAGASDYVALTGSDDADHILSRLAALRSGGGMVAAAALVATLQRLAGKLQHDVKNPVGNILGYIDILRDGTDVPPNEEQSDLLTRIERNCEHALELLARFAEAASRLR